MHSTASSPCGTLSATTMARASPTWRTRAVGNSICGPMKTAPPPAACSFMSYLVFGSGSWGMAASPSAWQSTPVNTPNTPGIALACAASIPRMRACGCGERSITAQAWPSRLKSSLKRPWPVTSRSSSLRVIGLPIEQKLEFSGGASWSGCVIAGWSTQRLGEAELVTVRIGQMEEALAPFRIARRGVRPVAGRDHAGVQRIDVGMIENDTPPPRPVSLGGLRDQIEIARSRPKARERSLASAVQHLEAEHAIEMHCARHIVGGERNGTNAFNHAAATNQCCISRSLALSGDGPVRMTDVAASVAPAHVID